MALKILEAKKKELPLIREMAEITWSYNYKEMLSAKQINYMLKIMYSDESLLKQLQNNNVFLIAKEQNRCLGFASYELNYENKKETRLHKIYVIPESQGKGVGKMLLNKVIEIAQKHKDEKISLTVNRTNEAVAFYKRLDFLIKKSVDKPIGNGFFMEDYIMKKNI